jgi:cation transport ATPase
MIKDLLHGHWGVDVLAVMAIVSTVAVGEYLAALVIVLMLSGGKALEDYAAAGPSWNSLPCCREHLRLGT